MRLDEAVGGKHVCDRPHRRSSHDRRRHRERRCPEARSLEHLTTVEHDLAPLLVAHARQLLTAEII
jgi:hypothetical protein